MKKDLKPKLNPRKPCNSPCTNCLAQAAVEGAIAGVQRPENQQTGSGTTYTSMQNEESGHIYFLNVGLSVCLSVSLPVCMHARIYRRICIRWVCVCVFLLCYSFFILAYGAALENASMHHVFMRSGKTVPSATGRLATRGQIHLKRPVQY